VSASERVVFRPTLRITDHFGDESFRAITCTGTQNSKQTSENTPKHKKNKINKLAVRKKNTQKPKPKPAGPSTPSLK